MITRRMVAFEANITTLLLRQCSMWTFTLKETIVPREGAERWRKLLACLRRYQPQWCGVRVFELHPGKYGIYSHGLHVHLVSHCFFSDRLMKNLCEANGWGHFDRRKIFSREAAFYVGKYLSKKRPGALHGMRLVSCFGPWQWSRLRSIICEGFRTNCFKAAASRSWNDGRSWEERGWMEKLSLVARVEWAAMVDDLTWNPETSDFEKAIPARLHQAEPAPPPMLQQILLDAPSPAPLPYHPENRPFAFSG